MNTNTVFPQQLKSRMKELKFTQESLAKVVDCSRAMIGRYLSGTRYPRPTMLLKIARVLQCHPAWLEYDVNSNRAEQLQKQDLTSVPILSMQDAESFMLGQVLGETPFEETEWVDGLTYQSENFSFFAIKMQGDALASSSNLKSVNEGDLIIFDPNKEAKNKDIVFAKLKDDAEPMIRQYVIEAGARYLMPLNPQYPMIVMEEKSKILGVAVTMLRQL